MIQLRQHVVGKVQPAVGQDIALDAGEDVGLEATRGIERVDLRHLGEQPLLAQAVGLETGLGVIRNTEVLPTQRFGRGRHLGERVTAVGRSRMIVKRAAEIAHLHQTRQLSFFRRVDLAQAFAQFRRNEVQIQGGKEIGLIARNRNRGGLRLSIGRLFPGHLVLHGPLPFGRHQSPLTEAQPARQGARCRIWTL